MESEKVELDAEDLEAISEDVANNIQPVISSSFNQSRVSSGVSTASHKQEPARQPVVVSDTFGCLNIDKWLQKSLAELSITKPTEIQTNCIPQILAGTRPLSNNQTAAFALPILQQLAKDPFGIYALVLTPTRELAFQIAEQFRVLGTGINLKLNVVVGGLDMMTQAIELSKRPHIIVATPGRLVDHIKSSHEAVDLKRLKFLVRCLFANSIQVFDEADRLLSESFGTHLEFILRTVPKSRQTLLFTATMTPAIEALQFSRSKPFIYHGNTRYDTVEKLDQRYLFIPYTVKDAYLAYILRVKYDMGSAPDEKSNERPYKKVKRIPKKSESSTNTASIIIFTGKWKTCERLYLTLRELGVRCTALHSHISQSERLGSIVKFKSGIIPILITTDVGSRGLDIPTVQVVINYDLPADATDYIHRVGRTARASRSGISISMICERDVDVLLNIEEKIEKKLVEYDGIPENEVLDTLDQVSLAKRMANLAMSGDDSKSKFGRKLRSSTYGSNRVGPREN